jgi:hypothetical protein
MRIHSTNVIQWPVFVRVSHCYVNPFTWFGNKGKGKDVPVLN